jgi:FkbM family methyltransferase
MLQRNVKENNLDRTVSTYSFALSDRSCFRSFNVAAESGHSSFFSRQNPEPIQIEQVKCICLAEAVQLSGAARIALLKVDTEGAECEVVRGGDEESWRRIDRVAIEFHNDLQVGSRERLEAMLRELRFEIVSVDTAPPFNELTGIILARK